jgi:glycosyltransferase involved in cell wall biosynthesis
MLVAAKGTANDEPRPQRMKLAIEVTTCVPSRSGVGYYTEHLVDALLEERRADDDVVLLSNCVPSPELAARWASHLHVRGPGIRALWMQSEVPRLLAEHGVDVAVFPNYTVPLASPCPSIVVVHDLAILRTPQHFTVRKRLFMRAMLRQSIATASAIATVSEASRRDIEAILGVSHERTVLLPAAAHPSCRPVSPEIVAQVRARHGIERPYILTVGTLEPRKNLVTLLRAYDALGRAAEEHDLVVVGGRGWLDRSLVRELEARAPGGRVRWLGYVSEPDLVALYGGAKLFVLASTLEGFGLPVLEAMACGTPVIASEVAALQEVGGDAVRYVPPGDAGALARAIARMLSDGDALAAARAAGFSRAQQFSWAASAETLWARARVTGPSRVRTATIQAAPAGAGPSPLPLPLDPAPPALDPREWALVAAVVYADLFDSPLPVPEALRGALGFALDAQELRRLAAQPRVASLLTLHPSGFLVLTGREHLVDAMPEREALTHALLEKNRPTLALLSSLPFVRSLLISGGLAHKNPGARPDVDLFVLAAGGRAYTAYTMLFLATRLTGTRHLICPNYLVDERELAVVYHRDLFTAHQLVSSRPFSGHPAYAALCRANEAWVRSVFPAFVPRDSALLSASASRAGWQRAGELALRPIASLLEWALRTGWRVRLRRRASSAPRPDVVLGDGILKLHLSDYRARVMDRFASRLGALRARIDSEAGPVHPDLGRVGT